MTYTELLESIEYWAGFNDGDVVNNTTLKKLFTSRLNRRLERYLGMMGSGSHISQIDDTNYSTQPFSFFDIVEDQNDYEFLEDEDGNTIDDITGVMIKIGDSFREINRVTLEDDDAKLIMSPNDKSGRPYRYLERNNTIFLDPVPNYSLSEGGKLFYKRVPSYFTISDTTKEPGIPTPYHELLAVGSAYDWVIVNKSNSTTLITVINGKLREMENDFRTYNELRSPIKRRITPMRHNTR